MKLFIRCGDGDVYHDFDDLTEAGVYLAECGANGPFENYGNFGIQCPGYEGSNYISAYWGTDVESPEFSLDADELEAAGLSYGR